MNVLATRKDRANLAVCLLAVSGFGVLAMLSNLSNPEINLIGGVAYLSALASSAITLFAVNMATYNLR